MAYLMAGQLSELERLRVQSRVWEPAGEELLARLGGGDGLSALEIGCGAMGWMRILSRWVGSEGSVTATDVDEKMLAAAEAFCAEESLANVRVLRDDFFATALLPASFDLVHLRFQLAPLGRAMEQVTTACRLAKPGGWVVLEDPETGSWREHPLAPSAAQLRALDEGRRFPLCQPGPLADLFQDANLETVEVRAIDVPTVFRDFDDYWSPFLGGQAPAPG